MKYRRGCSLPPAIKFLFDLLDTQAKELNLTDAEVLHTWKNNRYQEVTTNRVLKFTNSFLKAWIHTVCDMCDLLPTKLCFVQLSINLH